MDVYKNGMPDVDLFVCKAAAKVSDLVAHARDDGDVPVGGKPRHRLQGEGARWTDECDHLAVEEQVAGQPWSHRVRTANVTETRKNNICICKIILDYPKI